MRFESSDRWDTSLTIPFLVLLWVALFSSNTGYGQPLRTNYISASQDAFGASYGTFLSDELNVGRRTFVGPVTYEYRAAMKFDFPWGAYSNRIQSASLRLYYFDVWGVHYDQTTIEAYPLLQDWGGQGNSVFDLQYDPGIPTGSFVGLPPPRWTDLDVTELARFWSSNPESNHGLMLIGVGGPDNAPRFRASNYPDPTVRPVLEVVEYVDPSTTVGSLMVQVEPTDRLSPWAELRISGTDTRIYPNQVATNIPAGSHVVELWSPPGWRKIASLTVRVIGNHTTTNSITLPTVNQIEIGQIPTQRIYQGSMVKFRLLASSITNGLTRFRFTADPVPTGEMEIDPSTGDFIYAPSANDKQPFRVTFEGFAAFSNTPKSIFQTVEFQPFPKLPEEQTVLGMAPSRPLPAEDSIDYIQVNTVLSPTAEPFNNQLRTTRTITISGKTVIFQSGHPNGLYNYSENDDIKELNIHAETILIRDWLTFPQTTVNLYARDLRFEGENAVIYTTPRNLDFRPPQFAPGANGLSAGDVSLNIEKFSSRPFEITRFILSGGSGQPASDGQPGSPGLDKTPIGTYFGADCPWQQNVTTAKAGFGTESLHLFSYFPNDANYYNSSTSWRPGNGTDALPGGRAGSGGNAGHVKATVQLGQNIEANTIIEASAGYAGGPTVAQGGRAGTPSPAYKAFVDRVDSIPWTIIDSNTSHSGRNATSPPPFILRGEPGSFSTFGNSLSWLSPYALRMVLANAKDSYLTGHSSEAEAVLSEYESLLSSYASSSDWLELTEDWRFQFTEMLMEIQSLRHRIASHLDYFGNPAGWVPMLSFEANKAAYEVEIERAIRVMYLAYWIGNSASSIQAKLNGLNTAKTKTVEDIEANKSLYNEALNQIPVLEADSATIAVEEAHRLEDLKWLEQRLLARAQNNVEERNRVPEWKKAIGVAATICKVIPVYQPALAAVGTGLDAVANHNPEKPLDTAIALGSVVGSLSDSALKESAENFRTNINVIEVNKVYTNGLDQFKANMRLIGALVKPVGDKMDEIRAKLANTEAPKNEIEAELAKLKAESPEFQDVVAKIRELLAKKEKLASDLNITVQAVSKLSAEITYGLLSLDAMNRSLADGNRVIDERALSYLQEMDRRARERLLKFHYWVAKSYEYRLLKPYPNELNLTPLMLKMAAIASTNQSTLNSSDYQALKAVYEESLSTIANDVLTDYNNNRPEMSVPVDFNLSAAQLQQLNSGKPVVINLRDMGIFPLNEENIRIVDWRVYNTNIQAHVVGGPIGAFAFLDLYLEHSGISTLASAGKSYLFRHHNESTVNPFIWAIRYSALSGNVSTFEPSVASESLIRSLLGPAGTIPNLELYSRPAAWADIILTKHVFSDTENDIVVDGLRLQVQYDFVRKRTDQSTLEVSASGDLAPYFSLSNTDLNGRKDSIGKASRTYNRNTSVTVVAPTNFGSWRFVRWTDRLGAGLPGIAASNASYTVFLNDNKSLKANYTYANTNDVDADSITDSWERQYFGSITNVNLTTDHDSDGVPDAQEFWNRTNPNLVDSDGDGLSDFEEFIAGTSGTNAASRFSVKLSKNDQLPQTVSISWDTIPDRYYRIERANDQFLGWSNVFSIWGDGTRKSLSMNTNSSAGDYFRVRVDLPLTP